MMVIVSITPTRVEADSRTFKQAASFARFGYTSIVVEGERSHLDKERLPFELRTIEVRESLSRKILKRLRRRSAAATAQSVVDEASVKADESQRVEKNR